MNKGTALKWIDQIKTGNYPFGSGQLSYRVNEQQCYCAIGVLANFLDPNAWKPYWDDCSYSWYGEIFKLPDIWRTRCKIKSPYLEFVTDNGHKTNLGWINDGYDNWEPIIYHIEHYYEQF